jgi:hypothetical protein
VQVIEGVKHNAIYFYLLLPALLSPYTKVEGFLSSGIVVSLEAEKEEREDNILFLF